MDTSKTYIKMRLAAIKLKIKVFFCSYDLFSELSPNPEELGLDISKMTKSERAVAWHILTTLASRKRLVEWRHNET